MLLPKDRSRGSSTLIDSLFSKFSNSPKSLTKLRRNPRNQAETSSLTSKEPIDLKSEVEVSEKRELFENLFRSKRNTNSKCLHPKAKRNNNTEKEVYNFVYYNSYTERIKKKIFG